MSLGYTLQIAPASDPALAWRDISGYLDLSYDVQITRGRTDLLTATQPGVCTMTLDNSSGALFPVGATTTTNYATNPRCVTANGWTTTDGTKWTVARNTAVSGHPTGLTTAAQVTPTGAVGTTSTVASIDNIDSQASFSTSRYAGVWVKSPVAVTASVYLTGNQAATTGTTSVAANVWTWCRSAGASTGRATVTLARSGNAQATDVTFLTGSMALTASAPTTSWDGTTTDAVAADGFWVNYAWTGATNNSTSTAQRYGPAFGDRMRVSATDGTTTWPLFDGYARWRGTWTAGPALYTTMAVTLTDRLAQVGQTATLPNIIAAEYTNTVDPIGYWPLSESDGASAALDSSGAGAPALVPTKVGTGLGANSSAAVLFGGADAPVTDSLQSVEFNPVDSFDGQVLRGVKKGLLGTATRFWVMACFNRPYPIPPKPMVLLSVGDPGTGRRIAVAISNAGAGDGSDGSPILIDQGDAANAVQTVGGAASPTNVCNNGSHVIVMDVDTVADLVTLYLDGAQYVQAGVPNLSASSFTMLEVGGTTRPFDPGAAGYSWPDMFGMYAGSMAHVAIYTGAPDTTTIANAAAAARTGFAGETGGPRVQRIWRYAGQQASVLTVQAGRTTLAAQDTTGRAALDVIQEVVASEAGTVFVDTTGQVQFHGRAARWNAAAAVTLAAGQYDGDLTPVWDDWGVATDVTVTGPNQSAVRATQPSTLGVYTDSLTSIADTADQLLQAAYWRLAEGVPGQRRFPTVVVDVLTQPTLRNAIFGLDIDERLDLQGVPTFGTVSLIAEGYSEQINVTTHQRTYNCSPYELYAPKWVLGDATNGVLGSTTNLAY